MTTKEIRKKYLDFFKGKPQSHKEIPASPLILENDPTTLFNSSGMQPLVPYLLGEPHPLGKRLVDVQPSLRLQDIDEVGDNRHILFFEMLGNWSLGDYFKADQLAWFWQFLIEELKLPKERLWVSVFEGEGDIVRDDEAMGIWKNLGVAKEKIVGYGFANNWWSRSGVPEFMPVGEIGGPDSEVFFDFGKDEKRHKKYGEKGKPCHPNCNCGRFLEIGNSVFIQYRKQKDGTLKELPQKNVDFGGGLERIAMVVNQLSDIFQIDIYQPVIKALEVETSIEYGKDAGKDRSFRVIADHLRASLALISQGIVPDNKLHGYILRKLLRRSIFHLHLLGVGISGGALAHIAEGYKAGNKDYLEKWEEINKVISEEAVKFSHTLNRGLSLLRRAVQKGNEINGKFAFDLYQTDGFPLELTLEILKQNGVEFNSKAKEQFEQEFKKHKNLSRNASVKLFKGGLADKSEAVTRLHTATHLLHAALRQVLGGHVSQKGSNITADRLRFDFSSSKKLTQNQVKKVEGMVNQIIKDDVPVTSCIMDKNEATREGALGFFAEKYGDRVKVYDIGRGPAAQDYPFSREICGGPHVSHTGEIGRVRINKQEKIGMSLVRIYASINK